METFREILTAGGHANSLGRGGEVVAIVLSERSRLDELFECIFADDAWVRMRAVDSFEKVIAAHPEWAVPYIDRIFNELTKSGQPSVQWHVAQLFMEIELTHEQQMRAVAWLKTKLETTDVDWIVAANSMKALLYFYQNGLVAATDIKRLFAIQENHSSKSVRKKAATLVAQMPAN